MSRYRPILLWLLFIRFQLLLAAVLVAFPYVATGPASALLGNLFVLGFRGLSAITFVALAIAWALVITAQIGAIIHL